LSNSTKLLEIDTTISILTDTTIPVSKPMKHKRQINYYFFGEEKMEKRKLFVVLWLMFFFLVKNAISLSNEEDFHILKKLELATKCNG
jgi:hypothetical protein